MFELIDQCGVPQCPVSPDGNALVASCKALNEQYSPDKTKNPRKFFVHKLNIVYPVTAAPAPVVPVATPVTAINN